MSRNRPSSRTTAPISSLSISPKGCSMFARVIASRTAVGESPNASSCSRRRRIWTTSTPAPPRSTSLTPGTASNRSCSSWARSLSTVLLASPNKAMLSTGRSSTETCAMVGFSASAGSSASASATVARSRTIASALSVLAMNSTEMIETLSNEALLVAFSPCRRVSSVSILSVICFSTVWGSAPGHVVVIVACGMSRSGSDSLTSEKYDITPPRVSHPCSVAHLSCQLPRSSRPLVPTARPAGRRPQAQNSQPSCG